jgi:replicative DNA helicase
MGKWNKGISDLANEYGKLPPQSTDIEKVILGGVLLERDKLYQIIDDFLPEYFYVDAHRVISKCILSMHENDKRIDLLTVTEELRASGKLEEVGGPFYMTQLVSDLSSAANIEYHLAIIKQKYYHRKLIEITQKYNVKAYDESDDIYATITRLGEELRKLTQNTEKTIFDANSIVSEIMKDIYINQDKEDDEIITGSVPFGYRAIDIHTGDVSPAMIVRSVVALPPPVCISIAL